MSSEPTEPHSHQNIQHNGETYIKLSDAAETFKSLRAWRVALYDALTEWHDPPRDGETPKAALRRLVHTEILAALDPAISRPAAALATARREGMEEATQAPREIAMGHGLVDVCVCNHEGRYGLVLKPRAEYAPIGQETAPARSVVTLDGGCVVVWLDGPEFGKTIIDAIQEAAAIRAAAGEGK